MLGTGTAALASLLEAARQLSAQPAWPRDVAQARSCAKCGAVRAVQRRAQGPVNPGYFNFDGAKDTHAPYTMPMPFPNILFEVRVTTCRLVYYYCSYCCILFAFFLPFCRLIRRR